MMTEDKSAAARGKVVVITGGARGIGFATATALHRAGAAVAIGDVDEVALKAAATALDLEVWGRLDVTDADSFRTFLDRVEGRLGPIDVLVNNAGIMPVGRVVDEPDEVTQRILDINVYGVILGSKLALQRMLPRGRGHVINVASLAAETPTPGLATYCASKYAVLGFTDSARLEYRTRGVQFSAVLPTFTNTELTSGVSESKFLKNAEPQDIAVAILKLIAVPKRRVSVSRVAGLLIGLQKLLPKPIGELLTRTLGAERMFTEGVDAAARRAYEDRARGV